MARTEDSKRSLRSKTVHGFVPGKATHPRFHFFSAGFIESVTDSMGDLIITVGGQSLSLCV